MVVNHLLSIIVYIIYIIIDDYFFEPTKERFNLKTAVCALNVVKIHL